MQLSEWVVSCRVHGARKRLTYCYVQLDGEHIGIRVCKCLDGLVADCPIDFHRHLYVQGHPMWATATAGKPVGTVQPGKDKVRRAAIR